MMATRTRDGIVTHADVGSGALPEWFTTNRVHGHTRLSLSRSGGTPEFAGAGAGFKALGAHAFTRHAKTGDDDPWWPPGDPPPPNVVKEFIDEAHAAGLRIFAYYWHMSEKAMEGPHGDWICQNHHSRPIRAARRGLWLDVSGPYREVVRSRLRELAAMGVDGLFFDFRHLPPRGSWETALAEAWEAQNGARPPVPDDRDEVYQQFLDFKAQKVEETFVYWRDQVKADYPNVVFIVSSTVIPALTDREMTTALVRLADSSKNEFRHALNLNMTKHAFDRLGVHPPSNHVRQALGWTVLRDAADGRSPHIWAAGVPDCAHAKAFAGTLMTFGCIANMDAHESALGDNPDIPVGKTPVDALKDAFALGSTVSPHLAGTQPLRWAAIHYSERIRNSHGGAFRAAWEQALWPVVGAYQVLTEDGVPVGVVNDHQLGRGELAGYRVLVLPRPGDLTRAERLAVRAFRRRGGVVIEHDPDWPWSDPDENAAAAAAFRAAIAGQVRAAPLRVTGGPAGRYAVAYHRPDRLVVAVTNDFTWVQDRWTLDTINPPAPAASGVRVTWRKGRGLPPVMVNRFDRLQAVDAVSGKRLKLQETSRAYRVTLPRFEFMALLVVTRTQRPPRRPRTRTRALE